MLINYLFPYPIYRNINKKSILTMEPSNPLYIGSIIFYILSLVLFIYCFITYDILYLYMGLLSIFTSIIFVCPLLIENFSDSNEYEDIVKEKLKNVKKED